MDCIITAGGNPTPEDPLYAYTKGQSKALLDMNGRTMLERVVDALQGSQYVEDIIVVGLGSDMGLQFQRPVNHLPDQGSLIKNGIAGINWLSDHKSADQPVIASSADIPAITPVMVDELVERCQPFKEAIYYSFVSKEAIETRFPGSHRTFTRFTEGEFAGGDMAILHPKVVLKNQELWELMTNARKYPMKIARLIGLGLMFKLLLRRLSLTDVEKTATRMLGFPAKVLINPHAEMGMDGDKPDQIDMLRHYLQTTG